MFASTQNLPQDQTNSDAFAYPTGSSFQQTNQKMTPDPAQQTPIITPHPPIVVEQSPEVLPAQIPQSDIPMSEAEIRRNELEALIQNKNVISPVQKQTTIPTPSEEEIVLKQEINTNPTVEIPVPVPTPPTTALLPKPDMPIPTPDLNNSKPTEDTTKRLSELEQRIMKLEQTVGQWV